jgi:hypothetical protein
LLHQRTGFAKCSVQIISWWTSTLGPGMNPRRRFGPLLPCRPCRWTAGQAGSSKGGDYEVQLPR